MSTCYGVSEFDNICIITNGRFLQMIFRPFLAMALLATIVNGREPVLNELLKRVSGEDAGWSGDEPVCLDTLSIHISTTWPSLSK